MGFLAALEAYLAAIFATLGAALRLDPTALIAARSYPFLVPAGIALVGGISTMLGHAAILAINRVGRWRSLFTLLGSGFGLILTGALQAIILGLLAWIFVGDVPSAGWVLTAVLVSFAPYWFGFLILLPYSGPGVARVLSVWQLLCLWTFIAPTFQVESGTALLLAFGAWLGTILNDWLFEAAPFRMRQRLFKFFTGTKLRTATDILREVTLAGENQEVNS